jgi:hypothetical protein
MGCLILFGAVLLIFPRRWSCAIVKTALPFLPDKINEEN